MTKKNNHGRLIDADALERDGWRMSRTVQIDEKTMELQTRKPTDFPAVEPERIRGRWIDAVIPNDNGGLPVQVCDQCNTFFPLAYTGGGHRFCPNCGADMRGEEQDETD